MIEHSRFPQFLAALDASLVRQHRAARVCAARATACTAVADAIGRIDATSDARARTRRLERARAPARRRSMQLRRLQTAQRTQRAARGFGAHAHARARARRGARRRTRSARSAQAFDTADVARLRDRARLHMIVDRGSAHGRGFSHTDVAGAAREYRARSCRNGADALPLRFSFAEAAARAFGSDPARAYLERRHPSARLRDDRARRDRRPGHRPGARHRRAIREPRRRVVHETRIDCRSCATKFFRASQSEITRFRRRDRRAASPTSTTTYARALARAVGRRATRLRQHRSRVDRACTHDRDRRGRTRYANARNGRRRIRAAIDAQRRCAFLAARRRDCTRRSRRRGRARGARSTRRSIATRISAGLRPQRWRVAVLGALRRGKSSLINAFAGQRVLADDVAGSVALSDSRALRRARHALSRCSGRRRGARSRSNRALEEATRNPVLILTPWTLPRELVLVHAPAFDSGDATLEDVNMVAARARKRDPLPVFAPTLRPRTRALRARRASSASRCSSRIRSPTTKPPPNGGTSSSWHNSICASARFRRSASSPFRRSNTRRRKREQRAPAGWNETRRAGLDHRGARRGAHGAARALGARAAAPERARRNREQPPAENRADSSHACWP